MGIKFLPSKAKPDFGRCSTESFGLLHSSGRLHDHIMSEDLFLRMLCLERSRAERSGKQFVLLLFHVGKILQASKRERVLPKLVSALASSTRETDLTGWYKDESVIGVIFTELGVPDAKAALRPVLAKVSAALSSHLGSDQMNEIHITMHLFPEDRDKQDPGRPINVRTYSDLLEERDSKRISRFI